MHAVAQNELPSPGRSVTVVGKFGVSGNTKPMVEVVTAHIVFALQRRGRVLPLTVNT